MLTRRTVLAHLATISILGQLPQGSVPARSIWDVVDCGATGDGRTLDTAAVQAAINACNAAGGGVVYFPAGGNFLIGTIYLKSKLTLHVEAGAQITGSADMQQYGTDTGTNPYNPEPIDRCLIYATDAADINITGAGAIVGHGPEPYRAVLGAFGRDALQRPMLIRLEKCERIRISGLSLNHSGAWCIHLKNSTGFRIQHLLIENDEDDGVDIEGCQDGLISDCQLRCGDDCIALITSSPDQPVRSITITNCQLQSRWSGIRFGPASKGNFEDVLVSDCIFFRCDGGGIKLGMFEGAEIRNCIFNNIVMDQVTAPVIILIATWPDIGSTDANRRMMPVGKIQDLQFQGFLVNTPLLGPNSRPDRNGTMFFHGHPESAIANVGIRDFAATFAGGGTIEDAHRRDIVDMNQIDYRQGGYWTDDKVLWGVPPAYGLYARHTSGLSLTDVAFSLAKSDFRSPLVLFDSDRLHISHFSAQCASGVPLVTARDCSDLVLASLEPDRRTVLLRLEGERSKDVSILDTARGRYTELCECVGGAKATAIRK
jgi:hypothetical protein